MMINRQAIFDVLRSIPDPEMPISIVDLGLIESVDVSGSAINVVALPTFVGCPALEMISRDIEMRLGRLPGVASVNVRWVNDPPWSVQRITDAGRAALREHGVTVPETGSRLEVHGAAGATVPLTVGAAAVPCPFCGSTKTHLDSPFGPTRCRMIYYCDACRNSFEHLKNV
ncbi:MAG: phenylacetate-CoA oxygenase subunit PaaJ [Phycisphaerales bacterium]|nr:phenylacetate-CoA oxygenase subunit PaaJ [Phycisphaerales bacterium]